MGIDVSIIMPVYNAEKFLNNTIQSILLQSYSNFELIIINDGSSDNTQLLCEDFQKKDNRIRLINTENQGICKARNLGLSLAIGEYILFCDHDDIFESNLVEDNISLIKEKNSEWVKFGKRELILVDEKVVSEKKIIQEYKEFKYINLNEDFYTLLNNDTLTFVWDSIFKREIIQKYKIQFDEYFTVGNEDIAFCLNYLERCNRLIVNPQIYYTHYARLGISTSSKFSNEKIESSIYLGNKIKEFLLRTKIRSSKFNYQYAMTRLVLNPICRALTNAGNLVSFMEKRKIMKNATNTILFEHSIRFVTQTKYGSSKKLKFYQFLLSNKKYTILLIIDNLLKKVIAKYRSIKKSR